MGIRGDLRNTIQTINPHSTPPMGIDHLIQVVPPKGALARRFRQTGRNRLGSVWLSCRSVCMHVRSNQSNEPLTGKHVRINFGHGEPWLLCGRERKRAREYKNQNQNQNKNPKIQKIQKSNDLEAEYEIACRPNGDRSVGFLGE